MKKFFCVTPQQPEGKLEKQHYVPSGNDTLEYGETRFPIIAVMNGYLGKGDEARLVTVTYDSDDCRRNLAFLEDEVSALCENRGCACEVVSLDSPFDDGVGAIIDVFQRLIDCTDDGDELYACITYGSKPLVLAVTMALQYAYRLKSDAYIDCVVYGQMDRSAQPSRARIFDITPLVQLDEIVRLLADRGVSNPGDAIRAILG